MVEYHKPYVAFWLEGADGGKVTNLAVWYDVKHKDNEGSKWLKDMRQWWRRTGRELTLPVDGLSSPTRAPGTHRIGFKADAKPLTELAPGSYSPGGRGGARSRRSRTAPRPLRMAAEGTGDARRQGRERAWRRDAETGALIGSP